MTATTLTNETALRSFQEAGEGIAKREIDTWPPERLAANAAICTGMRNLFVTAHRSIEARLRDGMDARAFAAKYSKVIEELDAFLSALALGDFKREGRKHTPQVEALVANYESLNAEVRSLHRFLTLAVTKATVPLPAIDWQKIQEAEGAFARGEGKPFRRLATGDGSR